MAWVGLTEDQAKAQGTKVKKGLLPWAASGRAIANGRFDAVPKLRFDDSPEAHGHGKILGGGRVGEASYATPNKALHHAHVYSSIAFKATRVPTSGPQRDC